MTYLEEARLEEIHNGGYSKIFGHSSQRGYDECAIDFDRDEYRDDNDNSNYGNCMHFE